MTLLGASLAACTSHDTDPTPSQCLPTPGIPDAASAPAAGTGLEITEQGFRVVGKLKSDVSIGLEIKNATSLTAYDTKLDLGLKNKSGRMKAGTDYGPINIPIIPPGATIGMGAVLYIDPWEADRTPVGIIAGLAGTVWSTTALPVTTMQVTQDPDDEIVQQGAIAITGTTTSSYCDPLRFAGITAVFRDDDGKIVGGGFDAYGMTDLQYRDTVCAPGKAVSDKMLLGIEKEDRPKETVTTDFTALCDPFAEPLTTTRSG